MWQLNTQMQMPFLRPEQYALLTKDLKEANDRLRNDNETLASEVSQQQTTIAEQNLTLVSQQQQISQQTAQINQQASTIGQQNAQIAALQTTITQLQSQGKFPTNITKITQDKTITPGCFVVCSFPGGAGSSVYIAQYTIEGSSQYLYAQVGTGAVTAVLIYAPDRTLYFITNNDTQAQSVANVNYCRIDYNATTNNSIITFT